MWNDNSFDIFNCFPTVSVTNKELADGDNDCLFPPSILQIGLEKVHNHAKSSTKFSLIGFHRGCSLHESSSKLLALKRRGTAQTLKFQMPKCGLKHLLNKVFWCV